MVKIRVQFKVEQLSGYGSIYFFMFQRIRENCSPSKEWGPSEVEIRRRWMSTHEENHRAVFLNKLDNFT